MLPSCCQSTTPPHPRMLNEQPPTEGEVQEDPAPSKARTMAVAFADGQLVEVPLGFAGMTVRDLRCKIAEVPGGRAVASLFDDSEDELRDDDVIGELCSRGYNAAASRTRVDFPLHGAGEHRELPRMPWPRRKRWGGVL